MSETMVDAETGAQYECDPWAYTAERVAMTPTDDGGHLVLVAVAPGRMISMSRDDALKLARDIITLAVADTDESIARNATSQQLPS
jgi:hypothetical protein